MTLYVDTRFLDTEALATITENGRSVTLTADPHEAEAVMVMTSFFKDREPLSMPKLKWIQLLSAGFDGAALEAYAKKGITITNAKDVYSVQIAEDVFSKILAMDRNIPAYVRQMEHGAWTRHRVDHEIMGSVCGIVGAGSIGREVAMRMKAFGATTIGLRRTEMSAPYIDTVVTGHEGFMNLLSLSDYVIVSVPLDDNTFHMFSHEAFSAMKPTALLVNVARGDVIDQDALVKALAEGRIRGAALDVTSPEPLPSDSPLWKMPNVLITPHAASESPIQVARLFGMVAANLKRYLRDEPLHHTVDVTATR
jgi:D-2-hydroxyacid dehydrogenase (NADP+)